jgi:UDP-N-acetylglucosamine/UDP-N-acetylgalactosamine diphosphorylase
MTQPIDMTVRLEHARAKLTQRGQAHVLKWWGDLDAVQHEQLLADIESIPWMAIDAVLDTHIRHAPVHATHSTLQPAPIFPAYPDADRARDYDEARAAGTELLRAGRVAAFTVAGGQGTRLGVSGPKGMVPVTPVKNKSLFQIFAEMIVAARTRYGTSIAWYIMTSPANHDATGQFLFDHSYFGLPAEDVILFPQGTLPAFDFSGRLLMDASHRLSLGPDGHGGSLKALVQSGATGDMRNRGVTTISYFQVDNPLVKPFDPLFLGLHTRTQSEMSTKVARKAHDLEKVGNLCIEHGQVKVIEYSEMPEHLARQKNPDGSRRFDAANLASHLLDVDFVGRVAGQPAGLPLRRAEKAIPYIDENGQRVQPVKPNAVKLETFVFDVLPFARNPLLLEADRKEEFSPVKNSSGPDSLETSHRDQIERACRWLEKAGIAVPRRSDNTCGVSAEISPLFALDADELARKAREIPLLIEGATIYFG